MYIVKSINNVDLTIKNYPCNSPKTKSEHFWFSLFVLVSNSMDKKYGPRAQDQKSKMKRIILNILIQI